MGIRSLPFRQLYGAVSICLAMDPSNSYRRFFSRSDIHSGHDQPGFLDQHVNLPLLHSRANKIFIFELLRCRAGIFIRWEDEIDVNVPDQGYHPFALLHRPHCAVYKKLVKVLTSGCEAHPKNAGRYNRDSIENTSMAFFTFLLSI